MLQSKQRHSKTLQSKVEQTQIDILVRKPDKIYKCQVVELKIIWILSCPFDSIKSDGNPNTIFGLDLDDVKCLCDDLFCILFDL